MWSQLQAASGAACRAACQACVKRKAALADGPSSSRERRRLDGQRLEHADELSRLPAAVALAQRHVEPERRKGYRPLRPAVIAAVLAGIARAALAAN